MKVVIAGSANIPNEIEKWIKYWNSQDGYLVLDYPKVIPQDDFDNIYPNIHKNFFKNITEADVLFIANEKKNGIDGYIGVETFAELSFGLAQKLIYNKDLNLILASMPAKEVACYE